MLTRTTIRAGALVTAIVVLTGVVMLPHEVAAADPTDDQFVSLLDQKGIPALDNIPSLIGTAHRICRQLDGGMPVDGVVDDLRERAFKANPGGGQYPADRVARTIARFISASVEAYCPNNQPKIASLQGVANRGPGSSEPTAQPAGVRLASYGPLPAGETAQPDPPQLPPPPAPTAQILAPPPPVAAPSPRPQAPAPAQEPQPGPQQGPTVAPAPGGPPGAGGDTPPTPPGRVRLAP
ncbi:MULTISPECIES: DUF732 domain-containing protein [unclassified Mycobacterium]|uniref:DUF732 domain-containing protein n=1 Tax=unclassified Mycobacterium TaxID=2642494 RepID=UPI0007FE5BB8|nr:MULTISPECIES: DUF732 domain-containing protein [unclassified Mycobacterium]OBG57147.1 hypothetical protein A5704_23080 [Mycobacterium sp. E735]OBG60174.1 hypothetical protein A5703_25950 [Mycobacterium sp. E188]OBG76836.1 hypothetical protein A5701_18450 [Mycobacterium sp. E3305]OBG78002.1 hypothetical protein A9X05_23415 [Mycobacterium sp. E3298]OBH16477.1 hypothetical protein A9X03_21395 [Mycobacterium sp. E1715]